MLLFLVSFLFSLPLGPFFSFFFFNDTAPPEIYTYCHTLSLHDALPIYAVTRRGIYWGGAIFMLLADLDIRERSQGRASLETCFRAVLNDGGNTTVRWPRAEFLRVCDAATGTGSMADRKSTRLNSSH